MDPVLQELQDESAIRKLVVTFSLGMDARDVDMFRSAFADEIDLDLPPRGGEVVALTGKRRADDYARDVIDLLSEFDATQHASVNHLISVTGDTGSCTCYTLAQHYMPHASGDPWHTIGARYDLAAHRMGSLGWRLTSFKLTPLWAQGNPYLWEEAARRLSQRRAGK